MDRVYINTSSKVAILDHEKKRTYIIMKEGLPDVGTTHFLAWVLNFKDPHILGSVTCYHLKLLNRVW